MQRCFQLAKLAAGHVAPNPMVGAVLVYDDIIIGEGYHQVYGQVHAEVNCINSVHDADKTLINKSTLYVSLDGLINLLNFLFFFCVILFCAIEFIILNRMYSIKFLNRNTI